MMAAVVHMYKPTYVPRTFEYVVHSMAQGSQVTVRASRTCINLNEKKNVVDEPYSRMSCCGLYGLTVREQFYNFCRVLPRRADARKAKLDILITLGVSGPHLTVQPLATILTVAQLKFV